ncbi:MAG TPA: ribonucleotide reductase N-terminal alpha domain-containing protein, partial [candidate division Zixibacteria bacterium]|nr:ribonucleotide reductase N-terminal alpha domain-containing protein [candidate division Zixibacteria bacterium]
MADMVVLDGKMALEKSPELAENSLAVLKRRYLRKGLDGQPIETVAEMFYRVAEHVASAEASM